MKRGTVPQGYTIVEVMIFLVVTGALLASALLIFNGQQQRTRFTQAIRETDAQLRTTINEVSTGFYPDAGSYSCSAPNGTLTIVADATPNGQGKNAGCIFLGKAVRFSDSTKYNIYTILGRQRTGGVNGQEVTSISTAGPTALAAFTGDGPNTPDVTDRLTIPSGVTPTKVVNEDGAQMSSFAFMSSFGSYVNATDLASGASSVSLIAMPGTSLGAFDQTNDTQFKNAVSNLNEGDRTQKVTICFSDGPRQGAIVIGGSGRELGTEVIIGNVAECG